MRRRELLLAPLVPLASSAAARPQALAWRERALAGFGTTLSLRAAHADGERRRIACGDRRHQRLNRPTAPQRILIGGGPGESPARGQGAKTGTAWVAVHHILPAPRRESADHCTGNRRRQ